jgi:hypothetical protein
VLILTGRLRDFVLNNTVYKTGCEGCVQQVPIVG